MSRWAMAMVFLAATAFAMPLPKTIKFCPPSPKKPCVVYRVISETRLIDCVSGGEVGCTENENREILIYTGQSNRDIASTLVHEIMHAVLYQTHADNDKGEWSQHWFIYHLEGGMSRCLHDNKDVVDFLQHAY